MSDLEEALKALRLTHDKYQIAGRFVASKDSAARWPTEPSKSTEVDFFYSEHEPIGVNMGTGLTPLKLFNIASLMRGQLGCCWINTASEAVRNDKWASPRLGHYG
jgi:hypothetical protein